MGILYVVATPIGNLEDITLRALRILREVKLIAAEDTRKTKRLLNHYKIQTPLTSFYEHSRRAKLDYLLERLGEGDVALVSEAGMPGISDPGYELVVAAQEQGFPVVPVPGATAVITALAVSGLPAERFTFIGFLPARSGARRRTLESVAAETGTIVVLEAPHRLRVALEDIRIVLGDRRLAVCRELTKLHEEVFRGTVSSALDYFISPRGEFTLVIEGACPEARPSLTDAIEHRLHRMYLAGTPAREAVAAVAGETGIPKKEIYRAWVGLDKVWDRERMPCHNTGRSK